MKRILFPCLFGCSLLALLSGCSGSSTSQTPSSETAPVFGDGEIKGTPAQETGGATAAAPAGGASGRSDSSHGEGTAAGSSSTGVGAGRAQGVQAGTLTAGVWDDNQNFEVFQSLRAKHVDERRGLPLEDTDVIAAHNATATRPGATKTLDIQIVIDTTGSMGDEIAYLDKEFDAMVSTISAKYPAARQRWSLVAYKDKHDEYVVRWFDFRSDPAELHAKLSTLSASGGGDFPESPEVALGIAPRLGWREDADTARLLFWVADAPHHVEDGSAMAASLRAVRDRGIHVYPVAASGIDVFTELTMRSAAQLTGGRYLFLTDDSGIGDSHLEPDVPCYFVTKLNQAILRMVDIELSGVYREPTADEILRTGGDPQRGVCKVDTTSMSVF